MDLTEVDFKCKCWIQMLRTILFIVAFDAVWTCRETKTFQRNTLSPSSTYIGSEHGDIFIPIDGIDLQAHSFNTQNNNTVTYSGLFFSRWNFIALQKSIQYSQAQSESLETHVHVRPARSRNTQSYRSLPTGPLVEIFQHSLQFLQSESFQKHFGTIHRRDIGPFTHHNGTSVYSPSLSCTSPDDRMSSSSTV
jgi:hypothetical protein